MSGKPVTAGVVWFYPDTGRVATGLIDNNGRYTLGTFDRADGALLGDHKVVIEAREFTQPPATKLPQASPMPADLPDAIKGEWATAEVSTDKSAVKWLVPQRYAATATSPLRASVKDGPNDIDFDLSTP